MIGPHEDPTWPVCNTGECADPKTVGPVKHWCDRVAKILRSHGDLLHVDGRLCVPYLPSADLFVECRIGDEVSPDKMPGVHRLYVIRNVPLVPEPHNKEEIELALWSQGEGRASICLTVRDWVRGLAGRGHVPCRFTRHGYREDVKSQQFNPLQWEVNDFYCATESACWFCYLANVRASSEPDTFIDPIDDSPAGQGIRQRLRNR